MTLEFDPTKTASPEDLYGRRGGFLRDVVKIDKFIRVSTDIKEVRDAATLKGFQLTDFHGNHVLHKDGQSLGDPSLISFYEDRVDGHVWVTEQEFDRYCERFKEKT